MSWAGSCRRVAPEARHEHVSNLWASPRRLHRLGPQCDAMSRTTRIKPSPSAVAAGHSDGRAAALGMSITACSSGSSNASATPTESAAQAAPPRKARTATPSPATRPSIARARRDARAGQPGPGDFGGRGTSGEVTAVAGSMITVDRSGRRDHRHDGRDVDDTTVTESVEGSLDDLAVGDEVVVIGEEDGDAYLAATITEGGGMFGGGGLPAAGPHPTVPHPTGARSPTAVPDGGRPPRCPTGRSPDRRRGWGHFPGGPGGQFLSGTITEIDAGRSRSKPQTARPPLSPRATTPRSA